MKCVRNASGSRHKIQPHTESACYGLDRKHPVGAFLSMWLLAGGGWDLWSNPPMVHPFIALAGGRRNSCRHRETVSCHVSVLGYCIFLRPSSSFSVLWLCRLHCTLLSALSIVGLCHHQLIVAQQNSHGVVETSEMVSQYKFFPSQLFFSGIFSWGKMSITSPYTDLSVVFHYYQADTKLALSTHTSTSKWWAADTAQ